MDLRIGQGVDVHQFADGRRCILGGVEIPHTRGLLGHSDADVLTHALMDAILGAIGGRDIGTLFPDTDAAFKDADSIELLKKVWQVTTGEGWSLVNADITLLAEAPKVKTHVPLMRERLSAAMECSSSQVTIKATTMEGMGFVGRKEGVMASAVVLLRRP